MNKPFLLNTSDYSMIMNALTELATFHFDKSKKVKKETDALYHKEVFQNIMNLKLQLKEQKDN